MGTKEDQTQRTNFCHWKSVWSSVSVREQGKAFKYRVVWLTSAELWLWQEGREEAERVFATCVPPVYDTNNRLFFVCLSPSLHLRARVSREHRQSCTYKYILHLQTNTFDAQDTNIYRRRWHDHMHFDYIAIGDPPPRAGFTRWDERSQCRSSEQTSAWNKHTGRL